MDPPGGAERDHRGLRTSDMDYPPLYVYMLAPLGKIYGWFAGPADHRLAESEVQPSLTLLVKFPPLLFDLAIAFLLYGIGPGRRPPPPPRAGAVRRERPRPATTTSPWSVHARRLPPESGGPFNDGYWGEPDSVHCFFVLAAFLALGSRTARIGGLRRRTDDAAADRRRRRTAPPAPGWPAWVLLTLATLMKPLGAPFFPLLLVLSLAFAGLRSTLLGIGAAAGATLLVFAPFLVHGQGVEVARRVVGDVSLMAYTSSNAHNLWWVLGPWRDAEKPWLGPLTSTQVSLVLFAFWPMPLFSGRRIASTAASREASSPLRSWPWPAPSASASSCFPPTCTRTTCSWPFPWRSPWRGWNGPASGSCHSSRSPSRWESR